MNGLHIKSSKVDDSNDAEQVGEPRTEIAWIVARIRVHVCCILAHASTRKGSHECEFTSAILAPCLQASLGSSSTLTGLYSALLFC